MTSFPAPLSAVLPDLCAPRPAIDRGPEAEEGKGSVQCACWLCTGRDGDSLSLSTWFGGFYWYIQWPISFAKVRNFLPIPARDRHPLLFNITPIGFFVSVPARVYSDHFFSVYRPAACLRDNQILSFGQFPRCLSLSLFFSFFIISFPLTFLISP